MAFSITNLLARGKVGYLVNRENIGGYTIDSISIALYREERLGRVLAGTINNRDGYGSDEAARAIGAACSNAIEAGYDIGYYRLHAYTEQLSVRLEWQQYDAARYCSTVRAPHVGSELEDMFVGMNLLRWLGNKVDKDARNTSHALENPSRVVAALDKFAVQLAPVSANKRVLGDRYRAFDLPFREGDERIALLTDEPRERAA
jgi:hypothetical protein